MMQILYRGLGDLPSDIRVKINQEIRDLPSLKHISETNRSGRESATEILKSFKPLLRPPWSMSKAELFSMVTIPHTDMINFAAAQIGDDGLSALASACANGALAQVTKLQLGWNHIGDAGLTALASACANGALAQLQMLSLGGNNIGDTGLSTLATACANGAMAQLETLNLYGNKIGDAGVSALASACASAPELVDY